MEDVVDDHVFQPTDEASITLLRSLRTNTIVDHSFIHHADVCSAAPEELVVGLQPVPGTDETEGGYHSVWYFYCPKRYKNTRGKLGGHRQRAVGSKDRRTCWHSETGKTKPVHGVPGATFCNLSFVRKDRQAPRGHVEKVRLGWCMTEFDDTQGGGGDHVLCKVHRPSSSLAKKKSAKSSSKRKRKAARDDHLEAPPSKQIHHVEQVQVQDPSAFNNDYPMPYYDYGLHQDVEVDPVMVMPGIEDPAGFTNAYPAMPNYGALQEVDPVMVMIGREEEEHGMQQQPPVEPDREQVQQNPAAFSSDAYPTMPCYVHSPQVVDPEMMLGGEEEEEQGVQQQPRVDPEHGQLIHNEQVMQVQQNPAAFFSNAYPTMPCYIHAHGGTQGMDLETMFGGEEEEEHGVQPGVESKAEHSGDSGEFNVDDLLKMEEFNNDEWSGLLQMLRDSLQEMC